MIFKNLIPYRPSKAIDSSDRAFTAFVGAASSIVILLLLGFILLLGVYSSESIRRFGLGFLTGSKWNPVATEVNHIQFGALPYIFGTIVTSLIALVLATPLALGSAIFVSEYAPSWLGRPVAFIIESSSSPFPASPMAFGAFSFWFP